MVFLRIPESSFTESESIDDVKPIQSPYIKVNKDEIDKENKPLISSDAVFSSAKDVLSSDTDHVAKPAPLRKVLDCIDNRYMISNSIVGRHAQMRHTQSQATILTRMTSNQGEGLQSLGSLPWKILMMSMGLMRLQTWNWMMVSDDYEIKLFDMYIFVIRLTCKPDMDDFIAPDDSEDDMVPQKRKRGSATNKLKSIPPSSDALEPQAVKDDLDYPPTSTAKNWLYDPERPHDAAASARAATKPSKNRTIDTKAKSKPHKTEPEQRYTWLANILDADRNPPHHPDYDPRTIYIPPLAWANFSPFEKTVLGD